MGPSKDSQDQTEEPRLLLIDPLRNLFLSTLCWRIFVQLWFWINLLNNYRIIIASKETDWPLKYLTNWSEILNCCYSLVALLALILPNLIALEKQFQTAAVRVALVVSVLYFTVDSPQYQWIFINKHLLQSVILLIDEIIITDSAFMLDSLSSFFFLLSYLAFNLYETKHHSEPIYPALPWTTWNSYLLSFLVLFLLLPLVSMLLSALHIFSLKLLQTHQSRYHKVQSFS